MLMAFSLLSNRSYNYNAPTPLINLAFLFLLCFFLTTHAHAHAHPSSFSSTTPTPTPDNCQDFFSLADPKSRCAFLQSHASCVPLGFVDYLQLFYCELADIRPLLGYLLFLLCLAILFYLLGNTASHYFCSSLDNLSKVLKLSPAMAGVTLLSLGNGAPDLFSSIVSFMAGPGVGGVGLSSVLGGALFVTTVVVGVIGLRGSRTVSVSIDRQSFIRDVLLLILAFCSVLTILVYKKISIWGSLSFLSIYIAYVLLVCTSHFCTATTSQLEAPLLPSSTSQVQITVKEADCIELFSNSAHRSRLEMFWHILELPLSLPRRLTIPDITETRWHKPVAVLSVLFAPIFLSVIWNSQYEETGSTNALTIYIIGIVIGLLLCIIALKTTCESNPPKRAALPWLMGGFLMSVVWTYLVARELLALLVSLGYMLGISPSILGMTVLAWGNSLGDLISNVAMASKGGRDGVQIAVSGCYAGPLFNTVVGLGLSFTVAAWREYPEAYEITSDSALFETLFFLMLGLVWALLVLPRRAMKLDKLLGVGLLAIYLSFFFFRLFHL
ncbi:Sodium/calcium exchanger family protein [Rhynchospora pubera]|uniref:Sodium/calcium exchanger family protein n=1 Tax=Rhynchospora pubera TaxID=906938 RepID=A0AAV8EU61_9POAL|nr:Sodium/calcium exchanger family protein [Rhynchospora pubera]